MILRAERDYVATIEPDQMAAWTAAIDRNLELWIAQLDRTTVLLTGGHVAGFVMWRPDPAPAEAATLITVQVLPAFRRRGLGRLLLDAFARQAGAAGLRRLLVGVHERNPARALYVGAGYRPTGRDGGYLIYELDLDPS